MPIQALITHTIASSCLLLIVALITTQKGKQDAVRNNVRIRTNRCGYMEYSESLLFEVDTKGFEVSGLRNGWFSTSRACVLDPRAGLLLIRNPAVRAPL